MRASFDGGPVRRVKMLCDWQSSQALCEEWSVLCDDGWRWRDIELTADDDADFFVIINRPSPDAHFVPERTVVFQMEPWVYHLGSSWGAKTWGDWAVPDSSRFLHVHRHTDHLNVAQLRFRPPTAQQLTDVERRHAISSVQSGRLLDVGQRLRIAFLRRLEAELGGTIDVYGHANHHGFASYAGRVPQEDMRDALLPYRYYVMAENNSERNYATEKIWEPLACECLCFYWGCPNLEEHLDPHAFVRLNLHDLEASVRVVQAALREDWWSQRLPAIRRAKEHMLEHLTFFPVLQRILDGGGS